MTPNSDMGAVVAALRDGDRFLVTSHELPDGDALGSLLAMHLALVQLGKDSVMALVGPAPLPGEYGFLELEERGLLRSLPEDAAGRVLVAVDCAQETRLTDPAFSMRPSWSTSTTITTTPASGRSTSSSPDASSTAEVLADVFAELGVSLTPEIAEALYAGLVTDTGRFQYANTTPKALRLAAELLEAGADIQRIFQGVYESMQFAKMKLLARALDRATLYHDGRVVVSYLLRDGLRRGGGGGAVLGGDHRRPPCCRGCGARGADPRAAAGGQPGAEGVDALVRRPGRRVGDRAPLRWRGTPAGGRFLERSLDRRRSRS